MQPKQNTTVGFKCLSDYQYTIPDLVYTLAFKNFIDI